MTESAASRSESPADLRARWLSPEGATLRAGVVSWLLGRGKRPTGLALHEGRVDLRGIEIYTPATGQTIPAGRIEAQVLASPPSATARAWKRLDLSYARLTHLRFHDAAIADCRFYRADLSDLRLWNTTIADCRFESSDLSNSALGTWSNGRTNTWLRCDLVRCDLRDSFFRGARLTKCLLDHNRLKGVTFGQCRLRAVTFIGPLHGVIFDERAYPHQPPPSALVNVDFAETTLQEVDFRGCRFTRARWPVDPDLQLVPDYPRRTRQAVQALAGDGSESAQFLTRVLSRDARGYREDSVGVVNLADYRRVGGHELVGLLSAVLLHPSPEGPDARRSGRHHR